MTAPDILRFYTGAFDEWRWRVTADNGEIVLASTEGYVRREDAEANARRHLILAGGPDEYRVLNRQPITDYDLVSMPEPTLDGLLENARQQGRDEHRAAGDGAGNRIVVVKPGDSLLIGNLGEVTDPRQYDDMTNIEGLLKHTLRIRNVFFFEADINIEAVKRR